MQKQEYFLIQFLHSVLYYLHVGFPQKASFWLFSTSNTHLYRATESQGHQMPGGPLEILQLLQEVVQVTLMALHWSHLAS